MTPPESLTAEERAKLDLVAKMTREGDGAGGALAKLLRIHDRLEAEVRRLQEYVRTQDAVMRVRVGELEAYCKAQAEANEVLAQCLRERDAAAADRARKVE